MANTGHMAFVGRRRLIEQCRQAVDAELDIWLTGEQGVGKTALAKRISQEAIYVAHVSPAKELLSALLMECCSRGWYEALDKEGEAIDCEDSEKAIRKLDIKTATATAVNALKDRKAMLILDDFDTATAAVVRICRKLGEVTTVIACGVNPRPAQKPFLFGFTQITIPRLSPGESEELVNRLLSDYPAVPQSERKRLVRHLVEQAQGMPNIARELVKRAASRGELSVSSVRRESMSGHREIDMTPGMVVLAAGLLIVRVMTKGLGDHDLSMLMGGSGVVFMLVRFFAFRLATKRRR